jgi:hypothetical protein
MFQIVIAQLDDEGDEIGLRLDAFRLRLSITLLFPGESLGFDLTGDQSVARYDRSEGIRPADSSR